MTRTVSQALLDAAAGAGGYWFVDEAGVERFESYRALLDRARRVAGAFRARGLSAGDRVAIIAAEADAFLGAFFGALVAGLVPASIAAPVQTAELDRYLDTVTTLVRAAGVRAIVTSPLLRAVLGTVHAAAPGIRFVATSDELIGAPIDDAHEPGLDAPALLQFTSGSIAAPKGVVLTHGNLGANIDAIIGPAGLSLSAKTDMGVSWLPLFHDMGLIGQALVPLYAGGVAVLMSPRAFLKRPVTWLAAISRFRGTITFAPTFAYAMCVRRVKDSELAGLDLSCWRIAGCGAEPVHAPTLRAFAERFERVGFRATSFVPAYGLAESTLAVAFSPHGRGLRVDTVRARALTGEGMATTCAPGEADAIEIVSCGPPLPGHAIRIVDDDDRPVAERVVGEVLVAGPSVMRGYLETEPAAGASVRDGWLRTGDLGYVVDGELYVCGRRKETIVVHGRNYFPQDLEWAANQVAGVRAGRVAAFAATSPGHPDRVVLVVEADGSVAAVTLEPALRARVLEATGLVVDDVLVTPRGTISRTTSGKVQRARLRERYEAGAPLVPQGRGGRVQLVKHLLASQLGYFRVFTRGVGRRARESS